VDASPTKQPAAHEGGVGVPSRTRTDAPGFGGQCSIQLSYRDVIDSLSAADYGMEHRVSAIILAGGKSRRMGVDKAALRLEGETFLERLVGTLGKVTDDVMIVGLAGDPPADLSIRCFDDESPGLGPMAGLSGGLEHAVHPWAFVTSCDAPLLREAVVEGLVGQLREEHRGKTDVDIIPLCDAVVPLVDGHAQVLCAIYKKSLAAHFRDEQMVDNRSLTKALNHVSVCWISEATVRQWDPTLASFRHVNTPEQWAELQSELRPD
jgi:molybdopterin-guanine dinucleotide biosynthesis protein A